MCIYNNTSSTKVQDTYKPTWLYVKQHNSTGMKYFGKTIQKDPHKYKGSGKEWSKHISQFGNDVTTVWVELFTNKEKLIEFATNFSIENNIVESSEWANLIIETGLAGVPKGKQNRPKRTMTEEHKQKIAKALANRVRTPEHSLALSNACKGRTAHNKGKPSPLKGTTISEEQRQKMKGPKSEEHRKNIGLAQLGKKRKPLSEETRAKMSAARAGLKRKPLSQETKDKISASLKAKSK